MRIKKQSRRDAKQLFRSTFINGVMDADAVRAAVQRLIATRPRDYLGIIEHFKRLVQFEEDRRSARIESATILTAEEQATLKANVERIYGHGLNFSFQPSPALIAGVRVRVGSDIYDGSFAGRLQQLAESF